MTSSNSTSDIQNMDPSDVAAIGRLYFAYFGRIPEFEGLNYWADQYLSGMDLDEISARFYDSSEFRTLNDTPDNDAYIEVLYQNIFGRKADTEGKEYWLNERLEEGTSRERVLQEMSDSDEFRANSDVYFNTLHVNDDKWTFSPLPKALPTTNFEADTIVFKLDFENQAVGEYTKQELESDIGDNAHSVNINGVTEIVGNASNKELKITLSEGKVQNGLQFYKDLDNYQELFLTYQIRFANDFDFKIGKLPGLSGKPDSANGEYVTNPSGTRYIGPDEGFSTRIMFREPNPESESDSGDDKGYGESYIYHQNNPNYTTPDKNANGESQAFSVQGHSVFLPKGETIQIDQYVKMNSVGQTDGVLRTWINGVEVLFLDEKIWSHSGLYGVNMLMVDLWHGGSKDKADIYGPDYPSDLWVDNLAVSIAAITDGLVY